MVAVEGQDAGKFLLGRSQRQASAPSEGVAVVSHQIRVPHGYGSNLAGSNGFRWARV